MLKITDKEYDTFNVINATEEEIAIIQEVFDHTNFEVTMSKSTGNAASFYSEDFDGLYGTLDLSAVQEVSYCWKDYKWILQCAKSEKIRTVRAFMYLLYGKCMSGEGYGDTFDIFNKSKVHVTHLTGFNIDDILCQEKEFFNVLFNDDTKNLSGVVVFIWGENAELKHWELIGDIFSKELDKSKYSLSYYDYLYQGVWDSIGESLILSIFTNSNFPETLWEV